MNYTESFLNQGCANNLSIVNRSSGFFINSYVQMSIASRETLFHWAESKVIFVSQVILIISF